MIDISTAESIEGIEYLMDSNIIIFAGIDNSGKITIAEILEGYGFQIHHFGYSQTNDIYSRYKEFFESSTSDKIILDRSFLCEIPYGNVFRGYSRLTDEQILELLKIISKKKAVVVYLTTEQSELIRRIGLKGNYKDLEILEHSSELMSHYERILCIASQYIRIIRIDTSKVGIEFIISMVKKKLSDSLVRNLF